MSQRRHSPETPVTWTTLRDRRARLAYAEEDQLRGRLWAERCTRRPVGARGRQCQLAKGLLRAHKYTSGYRLTGLW